MRREGGSGSSVAAGRPSSLLLHFLGVISFDRRFLCQLNSARAERERERIGPQERTRTVFLSARRGCDGGGQTRTNADAQNTERVAASAADAAADSHLCSAVSPSALAPATTRLRTLSLGRSHFHGQRARAGARAAAGAESLSIPSPPPLSPSHQLVV